MYQKLATFFSTLSKSATDPAYYTQVAKAPIGFSFKYYTVFYFLLAAIITLYLNFTYLRQAPQFIANTFDTIVSLYPDDLVLTFDTTAAEISVTGAKEPLIVPMPSHPNFTTDTPNLLVIDTSAQIEQITDYQTAILLTKTHLVAISDQPGFQSYPLSELAKNLTDPESGRAITTITINKSLFVSNVPLMRQFAATTLKFIPWLLFSALFISYWIGRLIFVGFILLLTWPLSRIIGKNLALGTLFQIGLHTVTVTDAITKLSHLITSQNPAPFYTFAFLGITAIAIMGIKSTKSA